MNRQVKKVVAKYVKLMKAIVNGNGKVGYEAGRPEIPYILRATDIFYRAVIYHSVRIVKME
jgi:hypothetical protein